MTTSVIHGRYVLGMKEGAQALLRDHYVYVDGTTIEAVTPTLLQPVSQPV